MHPLLGYENIVDIYPGKFLMDEGNGETIEPHYLIYLLMGINCFFSKHKLVKIHDVLDMGSNLC